MPAVAELGRAVFATERRPNEPDMVGEAGPEVMGEFGITQPVAQFEADLSVPFRGG